MLSFDEVSFRYSGASRLALSALSLSLQPSEYLVLLGANGSGKSTLARLANGLLLPESGAVRLDDLTSADERTLLEFRRRVALLMQDPDDQIVATTAQAEVAFGPENLALPQEEIADRVKRSLQAVGLEGFEERDPNTLSGGQRQRLAIAGVLAMEPDYLVLDEPSSMLDAEARADLAKTIEALRSQSRGILHITHDLNFAQLADRVVVLEDGRLVFDGQPEELFADTQAMEDWHLLVPGLTAWPKNPQSCVDALRIQLKDVSFSYDVPEKKESKRGKRRKDKEIPQNKQAESQPRYTISHLSLDISVGTSTLISGVSGAGKSTLLKLMAGLLKPTKGTVTFSDESPLRPGATGLVFQHPEAQLFASTVADDILFGPKNLGLLKSDAETDCVTQALASVGLEATYAKRSPFALSGGEMRRVAIAGVVSMRRPFILFDEPTAGLDAQGRAFIHGLIANLLEQGTGVIVVSHDTEDLIDQVDQHLRLEDGQLWQC
ncbi:MAG: ATP-binding cassette domain-containing protein [Coriobacteriales bacterium]|jgi:energy-coupling factor transport system ATP-binding protein|nr:ATP-binding cassette domain-containing protein [Coriobacteriales bacterium]